MTKSNAISSFIELYTGRKGKGAPVLMVRTMREPGWNSKSAWLKAWRTYTDFLYRDIRITQKQYDTWRTAEPEELGMMFNPTRK